MLNRRRLYGNALDAIELALSAGYTGDWVYEEKEMALKELRNF